MTPAQKAAIAAARDAENGKVEDPELEEEANADVEAAEPIEGQAAEEEAEDEHSQPDYEAIATAEKERADRAEQALAANAFKARKGKREGEEAEGEEEDEDEDKPLTKRELRSILAGERQVITKTTNEREALAIARQNTATEAEAQAAVLFYKNRVVPTGNLEEDVLFAIGGLNRKRTAAKVVEVGRALRSRDTALHSTATVHRNTLPAGEPKISPQDAQAIKAAGMKWDGKQRVYKKSLGNGSKFMYYDPKTKKRWTGTA